VCFPSRRAVQRQQGECWAMPGFRGPEVFLRVIRRRCPGGAAGGHRFVFLLARLAREPVGEWALQPLSARRPSAPLVPRADRWFMGNARCRGEMTQRPADTEPLPRIGQTKPGAGAQVPNATKQSSWKKKEIRTWNANIARKAPPLAERKPISIAHQWRGRAGWSRSRPNSWDLYALNGLTERLSGANRRSSGWPDCPDLSNQKIRPGGALARERPEVGETAMDRGWFGNQTGKPEITAGCCREMNIPSDRAPTRPLGSP